MIALLTNHLWQSTLFAAVAALVAAALRRNTAHVRHWVWLTASVKFLLPFALLMNLGSALAWLRPPAATVAIPSTPDLSVVVDRFAQPFADVFPPSLAPASTTDWTAILLVAVWASGVVAMGVVRLRGWRRVRAAVRASAPARFPIAALPVPVRCSPGLLEPGVVGFWRPVLLLPRDIEAHLTPRQLNAVLTHEMCHVRRRDNLTAAVHMVVEAAFWFHPIVWWIGARLVEERERACDEHVLRVCGEPQTYAEGILSVCRQYVESPLSCVSGVTGSNLKRRIAQIMANRIGLRLNSARRIGLVAAAIAALAMPVLAGAITAPMRTPLEMQTSPQGTRPTFDVASVKPCVGTGSHVDTSPHRAYFECFTVQSLLNVAYAQDGNVTLNSSNPERNVRGGPDWIRAEKYTVEATTTTTDPSLIGAMMRALLEDRFHLQSHRALEQVSMYGLTVAKGGLKIKPIAEGDCVADDSRNDTPSRAATAAKPECGMQSGRKIGTTRIWELGGMSISELADVLDTDRKVVDQTGITGRFNIHLEYSLDETDPAGRTVFAALEEQLGLKLVSVKGPHEYFIVDRIERPVPDSDVRPLAEAGQTPPARFQVASIKPCESMPVIAGGRIGGGGRFDSSPGTINATCLTVEEMVRLAYIRYGNPPPPYATGLPDAGDIKGGPAWAHSDKYSIEAKAEGAETLTSMGGPMLRALLEDRFELKLHQDLKDVPAFALAVAAGGLRMKAIDPASCTPPDPNRPGVPRAMGADGLVRTAEGAKPMCTGGLSRHGGNAAYAVTGQSLDRVARTLGTLLLMRPVVDRTGVSGQFSFTIEFAPDESMRPIPVPPGEAPVAPDGPTLFAVVQKQLGLTLTAAKAQQGVLVIDSVQRPSPNTPAFGPGAR